MIAIRFALIVITGTFVTAGTPAEARIGWGAFLLSLADAMIILWSYRGLWHRWRRGDAAELERARVLEADTLTGALSRRAFIDRLQAAVSSRMVAPAVLLLVDVDNFKAVNDSLGHAAGDRVLQHLVDVATACFPAAAIGRLGGDEFAIMLEGDQTQDPVATATHFLAVLRRPKAILGRDLTSGASVGLDRAPDHASVVEDLMLCADLALYESKKRGRGCAVAFAEAMTTDQKHRRFIERELRAAILLDELQLHYQPLVDLDGVTVGVEALVRWQHPWRGLVPPGDFIAIAEQSTLIDMLGEWVLRRAVRDAAQLPGRTIAVNVSGAQLKRDELVDMVRRVFADGTCPADRFVFEITESVALATTPAVLGRLAALRELGSHVSLDDFGTGYAGFHSLRTLPVDIIKIDRSYIQSMEHDRDAAIIVAAVAAIGRNRGLRVVAEGIETSIQKAMAEGAGCTMFQGYLLGRPVPLASLIQQQANEGMLALAG